MFTMNLDKLKVNEAELKAFIYQQLNDLQPYLGEIPVAIKMAYNEEKQFEVTMLASHDVGEIEALGVGTDVFNALSNAKSSLIRNLINYDMLEEEEMSSPDRHAEINEILDKKNYIH